MAYPLATTSGTSGLPRRLALQRPRRTEGMPPLR